ncbi:MAG: hypothetical protein ACOCM4_02160 [Acetivibrio ethanolgignens]
MKYTHSQIDNLIKKAIKLAADKLGTGLIAEVSENVVQNAMKNGGIIEINFHPEILRINVDTCYCELVAPKTFGI